MTRGQASMEMITCIQVFDSDFLLLTVAHIDN
jgi:hypothetical protein